MSHFSRPACAVASGEVREEVAMSGCVTPHFQRGIIMDTFVCIVMYFYIHYSNRVQTMMLMPKQPVSDFFLNLK